MLSIAAVVSLALGLYETFGQPPELDSLGRPQPRVKWVEGVAIIVAILIVIIVGAANDYQKERQFAKLNAQKADREIIVIRSGKEISISIYDLNVGDVIILETGDVIPADAILISGNCECDESSITGESDTIKKLNADDSIKSLDSLVVSKKHPDPFLISGSKVTTGLCHALVTTIGVNSMNGKIMISLQVESEPTPLQIRLNSIADGIAKYGGLAALILFIVLFIKFIVNITPNHKYYNLTGSEKGSKFLEILIVAITLIVVAVPEGLPLAVTLALAFATTRMSKDGNLVRVLKACETMGGATCVCSDKTGTLTENRMHVVKGKLGLKNFSKIDDSAPNPNIIIDQLSINLKQMLLSNISINSTAFENEKLINPPIFTNEKGKEKVKKISIFGKLFNFTTPNSNDHKNLILNQNQNQNQNENENESGELFIGSKTETALLLFAKDFFGMETGTLDEYRKLQRTELGIESIIQIIPFESSRKWGGIVVKLINSDNYRFYIKGASEIVLSRTGQIITENDKIKEIDLNLFKELTNDINDLASQSLRTLVLSYKDFENLKQWPPLDITSDENSKEADIDLLFGKVLKREQQQTNKIENENENENENESEKEIIEAESPATIIVTPFPEPKQEEEKEEIQLSKTLIFIALVGIQDPLRQGVTESIQRCQHAGVTVRMVTGDNLLTARAIASSCGIFKPENGGFCMEGPEFRKLTLKQQRNIVPHLQVLARSSPDDKRILVQTLKDLGEVVAVTGDGTNDAPALKLADVGFSMGIAGTEVAREASDIILLTDDFTSIVNAIKWGRCVSTSIKKFLQFQLTVNITAVVLTFVSAVASSEGESVLTAVQLLWVNLIMDTFAALALATDKPSEDILDRKPTNRNSSLIAVSTWKMIIGQATMQLIVTFTIHFGGEKIFYPNGHITDVEQLKLNALTFNTFVWLQFWKLFVTRKLDEGDGISNVKDRITLENLNFFSKLTRNWYFLGIAIIIGAIQILIMFVGGKSFSVSRQTGAMWGTAIICGMISLPWGVVIRIIPDEWVIKIFPTRLFNFLVMVFSFKWLRNNKKEFEFDNADLESQIVNHEKEELYLNVPQFGQMREELMTLRKIRGKGRLGQLTLKWKSKPINAFKNWKESRSNSFTSTTVNGENNGADGNLNPNSNQKGGFLAPPSPSSKWSSSKSSGSSLRALAVVPAVVGGAVAGWNFHPDQLQTPTNNN